MITSGENDVSCDAFKDKFEIYHPEPVASKYNLTSSILSATKFTSIGVFCNTELVESIVVIAWVMVGLEILLTLFGSGGVKGQYNVVSHAVPAIGA